MAEIPFASKMSEFLCGILGAIVAYYMYFLGNVKMAFLLLITAQLVVVGILSTL